MSEPVLCFVDGPWAYFTTQPLAEQWGNLWGDAPFEHNAGPPHAFCEQDKRDGAKPWRIIKLAFDGSLETPDTLCATNSPYSVKDINNGVVPWLDNGAVAIPAGTILADFCRTIREHGGEIYQAVP